MKPIINLLFVLILGIAPALAQQPKMMFGDTTALGRPFSKDPMVIKFKGRYLMYYSVHMPVKNDGDGMQGWQIGIATSNDLFNWKRIGEIAPEAAYEKQGLCAPGAIIRNDTIHLFYQTYGNGPKDAICHATSTDGLHFTRDASNPVFRPTGRWTNGRAIDAEVHLFNNQYFLYFATRDSSGRIQQQGVAVTSAKSSFDRSSWKQAADKSILYPQLPWEGMCVEGASIITHNKKLYMFYAGSYNNAPQQIGVAVSTDGINWNRLSNQPFLKNGKPGEWNSSESGHPGIFQDTDGKTWLFYQGNNDNGHTWYLSNLPIGWKTDGPYLIK
ncbi:Glycosyl hydrolases family 43 [Mucilaginibacter gossypiicola]|uniref:Glycosyl hydrolases family 43 n=1 Tax=Mucilaginibacter gossypiicola TaxID=551995 RepID=A0A1H8NT89_9SPHI|nr:family 43 glycosylhydrolase [Mucilaginibacter gossypiicola]SEO32840.1 Glycosyl hydrolases family 43 [Mucilaginibacter gossypiicola]